MTWIFLRALTRSISRPISREAIEDIRYKQHIPFIRRPQFRVRRVSIGHYLIYDGIIHIHIRLINQGGLWPPTRWDHRHLRPRHQRSFDHGDPLLLPIARLFKHRWLALMKKASSVGGCQPRPRNLWISSLKSVCWVSVSASRVFGVRLT
jgi:hypothetical protein